MVRLQETEKGNLFVEVRSSTVINYIIVNEKVYRVAEFKISNRSYVMYKNGNKKRRQEEEEEKLRGNSKISNLKTTKELSHIEGQEENIMKKKWQRNKHTVWKITIKRKKKEGAGIQGLIDRNYLRKKREVQRIYRKWK